MEGRQKAQPGAFSEQAVEFGAEAPERAGVLEDQEILEDVARAARLDRADKALDVLASSLAILTAQNLDELAGLVVSTVATASQHPPRISVAVRNTHPAADLIRASTFFALSFLSKDQASLAECFASHVDRGTNQFRGVEYDRGVWTGAPVIRGSLAFLECKVADTVRTGDHTVFIADLLDGGSLRDGEPMQGRGCYKATVDFSGEHGIGR